MTTSSTDDAAPYHVLILNRDLFFGVRLGNLLKAAGYHVTFAPDTARFLERLAEGDPPVLGVIDMGAGVDWAALAAWIESSGQPTPVLAFGPHKDVASFRAAKAAGVTRVISNGDFHRDTLAVVRRYARENPPNP